MRTISGGCAVPSFSHKKIAKFLAVGIWTPITAPQTVGAVQVVAAPVIQFVSTPEQADNLDDRAGQVVWIRRIERHKKTILVEVDDRVFKLAPCPKKKGYACLLDTDLQLTPIEEPAAPEEEP